jgi:hypothetical protein
MIAEMMARPTDAAARVMVMMYVVGLVCGQELPAGGGEATMIESMTGHGEKGVCASGLLLER